jgi:hypothetical protein
MPRGCITIYTPIIPSEVDRLFVRMSAGCADICYADEHMIQNTSG